MTDKVIPSAQGDSNAYIIASLIRYAGGTDGWVQESGTALLADNDVDLDQSETPLGGFANAATSGFDLTVDTGEGFVGGAWLARDTQTTVTLPSSSTTDVFVGWDHDATNTVLVGESSTFGSQDPSLKLFTVTTDGSGITNVDDERPVGPTTTLGAASLGAGSTLERFLATAVADSAVGTAGASQNEVMRIPGTTSDAILSVETGDGDIALTWNAYFDGSWRYVVGSKRAYRLLFGGGGSSNDVRLSVADTGSADATITWSNEFVLDGDASWTDGDGTVVFDEINNEVPQTVQGGPAGSLSSYPLAPSDLQTGSGSGLDSDTVDGYEASELQGGNATVIDTFSTTDSSTTFGYDSGTLSTTYDLYKVDATMVNHASDYNEFWPRVQNNSTSNYETLFLDHESGVQRNVDKDSWKNVAKVRANEVATVSATIRGSTVPGADSSTVEYPTISFDSAADPGSPQAISGQLEVEYSTIDRIAFDTQRPATGSLKLRGITI